jgi:hypothetical protein
MPATYYQAIAITGVVNVITYDGGIESTEAEHRTITGLLLNVSAYQGNILELWVEKEVVQEVYDYHFDTVESTGSTNTQKAVNKLQRLNVNWELEVGDTCRLGIRCGGTASNVFGAYEYEIRA